MKKNSICIIALFCLFCSFGCVNEDVSRGSADVTAPRRLHPQQRTWNGGPLYERPTAEEVQRFRRRMNEAPMYDIVERHEPLVRSDIWGLVRGGQQLLRSQMLASVWHWNEVVDVTSQFGRSIPLLQARSSNEFPSAFAWIQRTQTLAANPFLPTGNADATVAAEILLHEATHAVFQRVFVSTCQFTHQEFMAMLNRCRDIDYEELFAQETLAYLNEAHWVERYFSFEASPCEFLPQAKLAWQGNPQPFARIMVNYARGEMNNDANRLCGPPIILRGPRAGEYCLPAVVPNDRTVLLVANAR